MMKSGSGKLSFGLIEFPNLFISGIWMYYSTDKWLKMFALYPINAVLLFDPGSDRWVV
jgi:hypothetical protein